MASFSLRCEMRCIILRGVQRLHDIEMLREVSEFLLLEARMVIAASQDGNFADRRAPSLEEIAAARDAIKAAWDDEERECRRLGYAKTSAIIDEKRLAQRRKYEEVNREKIKERNRARLAANRDQINARKRELWALNVAQAEKKNAYRRELRRKQHAAVAC
jgi:hypothetical protein